MLVVVNTNLGQLNRPKVGRLLVLMLLSCRPVRISHLVIYTLLMTTAEARKLAEKIKKKGGGELVGSTTNFVDSVWGKEKPSRPNEKVRVHSVKYSGKEISDKIADVVKDLDKKKAAGLVICKSIDCLKQCC